MITEEQMDAILDQPGGIYVTGLVPGSVSERMGVLRGDTIFELALDLTSTDAN